MITSMFWMSCEGRTLRSTVPVAFEGTTRRPFISTSVRLPPRPRSCTLAWPPFDGLFDDMLMPGTNCGIWLSSVSSVVTPVRSDFFSADRHDRRVGDVVLAGNARARDDDDVTFFFPQQPLQA